MKTIGIYIIILLSITISCDQKRTQNISFEQKISLEKEYQGFWAETGWSYKFHKDGSFLFKYEGHFGFGTDTGRYTIVDNILLLIPNTDWESTLHGVLKEKIKIVSADCIRDYDNNYYCLDFDSINYYNESAYNFQESAIKAIDSLPMVINEKKRLTALNLSQDRFEPRVEYNRIIVVNREELHSFSLSKYTGTDTHYFLNFLVREKPFRIYEHHSAGDSLSVVYSE